MGWNTFTWFAIPALILQIAGALAAWKDRKVLASTATLLGICLYFAFILGMWASLDRPPLRTMGETRLWYAFFLPVVGILVYSRWDYKWILSFSTLMSTVFTMINLFKPEIHSQALVPALQSPWFAPHVIVYMFAYALLGAATLLAVWMLASKGTPGVYEYSILDNLVRIGLCFMTLGMLMGALWANEAWGDCWTWDPKETWAAVTWMGYLCYIHLRHTPARNGKAALWVLILSFACLQMCWWGVNYLPAARGRSVHTYNS
ncbi:MAG: cytochrome c biogenesis protein CcsA [Candidatus Cryptobacteroides sp.]